MDVPDTRYARSGDVSIAYQTFGEGPIDLVFAPGFVSNIKRDGTSQGARSSSAHSRRSRA